MIEQIIPVVAEVMGVPVHTVGPDSSAKTVESWDSLRHMNLIVALEDTFAVRLDEDVFARLDDVASIAREIERAKSVS
jgi:acyl carrier protein